MNFNLRRTSGFCLLLISLGMVLWSAWPSPTQSRALVLEPSDFQMVLNEPGSWQPQNEIDRHELKITWPEKVRVGDVNSIHLSLIPLYSLESEAEFTENKTQDSASEKFAEEKPGLPMMVEARLEIIGIEYAPSGQASQRLLAGEPVNFAWKIRADKSKVYEGTIWISLLFSDATRSNIHRQVLSAQRFTIQGVHFLGLDSLSTRLVASLGMAIGVILSMDRIFIAFISLILRKFDDQPPRI